jgi:hypothetical protein
MNDKNNLGENLSAEDEQLFQLAAQAQFDKEMELFDEVSNDGVEIPNLADFDKRMIDKINKMYIDGRKHRRKKIIFKTVAVAAAIILLSFVFYPPMFGKINAFFIKIMNIKVIDKEEYTEFRPESEHSIEEFEGYYYPRYIPDNYEIIVKSNMDSMGTIIYLNELDGTRIDYSFISLNSPIQLDTENCDKEDILINNYMGLLYTKRDNSQNIVIFQGEEYNFVVSGNIDVETLKKVAESIEK